MAPSQADAKPETQTPPPAPAPGVDRDLSFLGVLNRHWYRRCLDTLEANLKRSGGNPNIEELRELCDKVITAFLTAVTAQAPDSDQLQFPADRAYYIPFEGDNAERFNFTKPFYQLLSGPFLNAHQKQFEHSLWSFFPWDPLGRAKKVEINRARSLDDDQWTINFDAMIAVGQQEAAEPASARDVTRLRKSVLVRAGRDDLLDEVFACAERGDKLPIADLESALRRALVAVFETHKETAGNFAAELLLFNHIHVIRWLLMMLEPGNADRALSQQDQDYDKVRKAFLEAYFLSGGTAAPDRDRTLNDLKTLFVKTSHSAEPEQSSVFSEDMLDELTRKLMVFDSSPFMIGADVLEAASNAKKDGKKKTDPKRNGAKKMNDAPAGAEPKSDPQVEKNRKRLEYLRPYLLNFCTHFLSAGNEKRLDRALGTLEYDLLKTGDIGRSFVWVCPDFEILNESMPKPEKAPTRFEVEPEVQRHSPDLAAPLVEFYRRHDFACLRMKDDFKQTYLEKLEDYWRAKKDPSREERLFASFELEEAGLAIPDMFLPKGIDREELARPRPQNIFLRVKICDLSNEPVINGLFVFTSDHDEVKYKAKQREHRQEDVQDLLAFAKVYFFNVRDHLQGLDRARDAREIGILNQNLYEVMIRDLNERMKAREERLAAQTREQGIAVQGITDAGNWDRFLYEVLNSYAYSLLEKPEEVRIETFQYDRLLLLPLAAGSAGTEYALPFYLFQSIFCERTDGVIASDHYALIKPTQSPVERLTGLGPEERFRARSFEKSMAGASMRRRSNAHLEKHYVGEQKDAAARSLVPKLITGAAQAHGAAQADAARVELQDHGAEWARWVLMRYWRKTTSDLKQNDTGPWTRFLTRLTADYGELCGRLTRTDADRADYQWFLFRLGLLRIMLRQIDPADGNLQIITANYARTLELRFDDNPQWDILDLAARADADLFREIGAWLGLKPEDPQGIAFVPFQLRDQDEFVLDFLETITDQIANDTADADGLARLTWYHSLLTRPIGDELEFKTHLQAGKAIGPRRPPYAEVRSGAECIGMFLGVVHLEVGQNERDKRRLSFLIAMLRDYDRSQATHTPTRADPGAGANGEFEDDIKVDLQDLNLFTKTFFERMQGFVRDSNQGQQLRILSTDISQIARNWYSSGIDAILRHLEKELQPLLRQWQERDLGRLQPEIVDGLVDAMLQVLVRPETRQDRTTRIFLESFPFDRLVHVPLFLGHSEGARLSYARTTIDGKSWHNEKSSAVYDAIRKRGRNWDAGDESQRGKKVVYRQATHLGRSQGADKVPTGAALLHAQGSTGADPLFKDALLERSALLGALDRLAEDDGLLDQFVRGLYEANTIQTVALAGMIVHLLGRLEETSPDLWNQRLEKLAARVHDVLRDSIEIIERHEGFEPVKTNVHMSKTMAFAEGEADAGNWSLLPLFRELFQVVEGDDFLYGLSKQAPAKVFFVYYSVLAPQEFTEAFEASGARYRGVFVFVLDDATTDVKEGAADTADREDIRTFVHNCARSLKHVLDQQALRNQMLQPGVEQFVTGIMHRLKNELGVPAAALDEVRNVLNQPDTLTDKLPSITAAGIATFAKTRDLFLQLKAVSDRQQDEVLLETYSSNWLGWALVKCLCDAIAKVLMKEDSGIGAEALRTTEGEIRGAGKRAEDGKKDCIKANEAAPQRMTDRIQTELIHLQDSLARLVRPLLKVEQSIQLSFGYEVFASETLRFRASQLIGEALTTLTENAFQAMWDHLLNQIAQVEKELPAAAGLAEPIAARLELVCRRSDPARGEMPGEIMLELRNSSDRPDPRILKFLQSPTPQLVTTAQYKKIKGGSKKTGGSGFGHFFARRIILDVCGGRKERRRLDIQFRHDPLDMLAHTTVNLLEAPPAAVRKMAAATLLEQVAPAFRARGMLFGHEPAIAAPSAQTGASCWFPADVEPRDLFGDICRLLEADRIRHEESIRSWVDTPCEALRVGGIHLQKLLAATVNMLPQNQAGISTDELRDLRRRLNNDRREGSWPDLEGILKRWRKHHLPFLEQVLERCGKGLQVMRKAASARAKTPTDELDAATLQFQSYLPEDWQDDPELTKTSLRLADSSIKMLSDFARGADLDLLLLIPEDVKKKAAEKFAECKPSLTPEARAAGFASLMKDMELDVAGAVVPNEAVISAVCLKRYWTWEAGFEADARELRLAFRLYDGKPDKEGPIQLKSQAPADFAESTIKRYMKGNVGMIFLRHRGTLARESADGTRIGEMWLEKEKQAPYRTVYLVLNLARDRGHPRSV